MEPTAVGDGNLLAVESALFGAMAAIHMKHVAPTTGSVGADAVGVLATSSGGNPPPGSVQVAATEAAAPSTAASTAELLPLSPPQPRATRGRPRMHGSGRKKNQSLRTSVTYAHKLAVIDFYEAHSKNINATVREFYAHLSDAAVASRKRQIYKWVKERGAIEQMCFKQATAGQSRRRERGTATTLGAAAEQELVAWIRARQQHQEAGGGGLSTQMIKAKAIEIAGQHGVPAGSFQATWSWQQGFFKRHQVATTKF